MSLEDGLRKVRFIHKLDYQNGQQGLVRMFGLGVGKNHSLAVLRKGYLEDYETIRLVNLRTNKLVSNKRILLMKNTMLNKVTLSRTEGVCCFQTDQYDLRVVRLRDSKYFDYRHSTVIDGCHIVDSIVFISSSHYLYMLDLTKDFQ